MAIRLLICQLVFVLVLAQASSSILDDTSSGSGAIEDTPEIEDETPDENSGLDDINDSNLLEGEFDEMTSLDETDDESLPEELMAEKDLPEPTKRKIQREARRLERRCRRRAKRVFRAKYTKKRPALRLYYQAYTHGKKSSINDKELKKALKSEKCSACVLNRLCRNSKILGLLPIRKRIGW